MFKLDSGVAPPRAFRYPWNDMAIGDSFSVPDRTKNQMRSAASAITSARGWKFLVDDCPKGEGVRVWRMA